MLYNQEPLCDEMLCINDAFVLVIVDVFLYCAGDPSFDGNIVLLIIV